MLRAAKLSEVPFKASFVKGRLFGKSSGGTTPPVISCLLPLSATPAQLLSRLGWGKLTPSNDDQTGTYTVAGAEQVKAMSIDGVDLGTKIPYSTGTYAFRVSFDIDALTGGSAEKLNAWVWMYGAGYDNPVAIKARAFLNSSFGYEVIVGPAAQYSSNINLVALPTYFDVLIANGRVRVWAETTELSDGTGWACSDIDRFPIMQVYEGASIGAANLGKTATINFITSASDMAGSAVPAGTTDLCGNEI